MSGLAGWLARLYTRSLCLYPRSFRCEFADEAVAVFDLGLKEAAGGGSWGLMRYAARELYDLPLVLLTLHARERRKSVMQKKLDQWFIHAPGSWAEVLLACTPFLALFIFPGVFSFSQIEQSIPGPLGLALLAGLVLFLAVLGIVGLLVRLPRWVMPYAGVFACLVVMFTLMLFGLSDLFFGKWVTAPWWLRMAAFELIYLAALVAAMALVVWLARRVALTGPFFEQVQKDWTQLSFAMYGGGMVFILGMYEDIHGAGMYILLTTLPLLLGTWLFLRGRSAAGKLTALAAAVTLAMGIAFLANLQLMDWISPVELRLGGLEITRNISSLLLTWLLCEAMLFVPLLLQYIPFTSPARKQAA
jgi:hypothetical protein